MMANMDLISAAKVTRGLFWFVVGTALFVTGVIMTVGSIIGGYDHEWYIGLLGMIVGAGAAGYFSIIKAMRENRS
jgi:hypothetical protein